MENSKMKQHVTVVGAIQIGFSSLGLLIAVASFFALTFARDFAGNDEAGQMVLGFLAISVPLVFGAFSTLGLVAGIGLLAYKPWARYLVIVVSTVGCINIPFGTVKGIYSLWVLIQDETIKLFHKNEETHQSVPL